MESIWKDKKTEKQGVARKQIRFSWYLDAGKWHSLPYMGLLKTYSYSGMCIAHLASDLACNPVSGQPLPGTTFIGSNFQSSRGCLCNRHLSFLKCLNPQWYAIFHSAFLLLTLHYSIL